MSYSKIYVPDEPLLQARTVTGSLLQELQGRQAGKLLDESRSKIGVLSEEIRSYGAVTASQETIDCACEASVSKREFAWV